MDVRRRLLDAARELFIEVGFDAASTKAIARRAGVNAAMINYYFDSKEGLSKAMLVDAVAPMIAELGAIEAKPSEASLANFVRGYRRAITLHPWLPKLIVREVLAENGRLRAQFVEEMAARAAEMLRHIVEREQQSGRLRPGVDPQLLVISLISLTIFPFLAAPILEPVLHLKVDDAAFVERLNEHSVDLLECGIAARGTK